MLFSILFVSFAKSAIINSTHSFTNSSNLTNLYALPQETPPSYLDSTPILGYQNLKKRTNKKRIKRDTNLQTSRVKCEAINEKNIKPNDMMPSECVCQELLKNLCSRIIKKLNYDLSNPFFNKNEVKLSEDIFTDYVNKFINKEKVTINSSVDKDYDFVLAEVLWFPIYLLSNKNLNDKNSKTLENLHKDLINILKIEIDDNLDIKIVKFFNISDYRKFIVLIKEKLQVNDDKTCALENIINEHLKALDDEEKLFIKRKRYSFTFLNFLGWVVGLISLYVFLKYLIFRFSSKKTPARNDFPTIISNNLKTHLGNNQQVNEYELLPKV